MLYGLQHGAITPVYVVHKEIDYYPVSLSKCIANDSRAPLRFALTSDAGLLALVDNYSLSDFAVNDFMDCARCAHTISSSVDIK